MSAVIRKIVTVVEETHIEMGKTIAPPTRRAAAIAVIENPFAGRYVEDLSPLIAIGEELGELLSKKAVAALGIDGTKAHSYGKAAAFVRSHFDGMEVQINDAPRANEIMVAVAVTDSGRPLPRVGGLTVAEVKGED